MTAYKNRRGLHAVIVGRLDSNGVPLDPSIPGNALVLPGKLFATGTPNITNNEETITSTCDEDYVETSQTADIDIVMCEIIRPEFFSFITGTAAVVAGGSFLDADGQPVAATVDPTVIDGVDADSPVGFVAPALGAAGNCCATQAQAAGLYMGAWRCAQQCGNTGFSTTDESQVYSFTLFPKITGIDLTSAPVGWDANANAQDTWEYKARLGNSRMGIFDQVFPGYDSEVDPQTPFGQWLTTIEPPFQDECGCSVLKGLDDDEDRAPVLATAA